MYNRFSICIPYTYECYYQVDYVYFLFISSKLICEISLPTYIHQAFTTIPVQSKERENIQVAKYTLMPSIYTPG